MVWPFRKKDRPTPIDDLVARLEPWKQRHRRLAWIPQLRDAEGRPSPISQFGGLPWLTPQEAWPLCGVCRRPMSLFLQLDVAALPEELGGRYGDGLLQLFYCTRDNPECDRSPWEPFERGHLARIIQPAQTSPPPIANLDAEIFPCRHIVSWERIDDLPHPEDHVAEGLVIQYDLKAHSVEVQCPEIDLRLGPLARGDNNTPDVEEVLGFAAQGDKLAGWPYWVQGSEYPKCPRCSATMELLFQIDSEQGLAYMFGDCGMGHITQCPNHRDVLAFAWACH